MADHEVFALGDVTLQSGAVLEDAKLAYKTWGTLNAARDSGRRNITRGRTDTG